MKLGDLKKYRRKAKLSQAKTADALGVSQGAISQWESGATCPSAEKLPELAKLYGCSIDDLFNADERRK